MTPAVRVVAVVLAGGRSRRFGRDKAAVLFEGEPSLGRAVAAAAAVLPEVWVSGGEAEIPRAACGRLRDPEPGGGPLQALAGCMRLTGGADLLVLTCDAPRITPALVRLLVAPLPPGVQARIPAVAGRAQLLLARYGASCAAIFERCLDAGLRSVRAAVEEMAVDVLDEPALRRAGVLPADLADFDTPEDLEKLRR